MAKKLTVIGLSNARKDREIVRKAAFSKIHEGKTYVDGYKLDEIQMCAVLENKKDCSDLVELLQIASKAFKE